MELFTTVCLRRQSFHPYKNNRSIDWPSRILATEPSFSARSAYPRYAGGRKGAEFSLGNVEGRRNVRLETHST